SRSAGRSPDDHTGDARRWPPRPPLVSSSHPVSAARPQTRFLRPPDVLFFTSGSSRSTTPPIPEQLPGSGQAASGTEADMSWWNSSRAVYGAALRAGAQCLVDHGWPVVPGTWWQGGAWRGIPAEPTRGLTIDLSRAAGWDSVPAVSGGVSSATCDSSQVSLWWSRSPFSVLLATGSALDVVEMPAYLGRRVASTLRRVGVVAPLAATPAGRWWLPVTPGSPLNPELAAQTEVVLHGSGSWVIAPPSE